MNIVYLKQSLSVDSLSKGEIKGVAYSGSVIKNHGPFENLIIDLSTLSVAKPKTPIFRDHMPFQVAGQGVVTIDKNVTIEGKISSKNQFGQEIISLAEDGFDWEMSLGVFDGMLEEFENEEYNGFKLEKGVVLKNGIIREVSIVALGADKNTSAEVFSQLTKLKGENNIMLTKEQYIKLACGCGGSKDTTPEELEQKFAASQEEIDKAKIEIEELKKQIAEKQAIIDSAKEEANLSARVSDIAAAISEKNLEFSATVLENAAKSEESKAMFLSLIEGMEVQAKKIDEKFVKVVDLSKDVKLNKEDPTSIQLKANKLVEEGKAKDFLTALDMLGAKNV